MSCSYSGPSMTRTIPWHYFAGRCKTTRVCVKPWERYVNFLRKTHRICCKSLLEVDWGQVSQNWLFWVRVKNKWPNHKRTWSAPGSRVKSRDSATLFPWTLTAFAAYNEERRFVSVGFVIFLNKMLSIRCVLFRWYISMSYQYYTLYINFICQLYFNNYTIISMPIQSEFDYEQ